MFHGKGNLTIQDGNKQDIYSGEFYMGKKNGIFERIIKSENSSLS